MENAFNRESASEARAKGISTPFQISLHSLQLAFLLLSTIVGFEACQQKSKTEATQPQDQQSSLPKQQKPTNPVLSEYEQFLLHLDSSDVTTVTLAANKYAALFKGQPQTLADSGYVLFDKFYLRVDNTINEIHANDTTNYYPLVIKREGPISKKLLEYNRKIKANGFEVATAEGGTYLNQDRDFIARNFYSFLSSDLKEYLIQVNKEYKEGFGEDGGLIISPIQFADKIIWWENFLQKHHNFLFRKEGEEVIESYMTIILIGMENTPVLEYGTNKLDPYYFQAYNYLLRGAPNTKAAKIIKPYFQALQKSDTTSANALIKKYQLSGMIYNPYE